MEEEQKVAKIEEDSTPVQDAEESESSTDEAQVEEATSEQATEKQTPFHEHPRWKEIQEEKLEWKERAQKLEEQYLELAKPKTPEADPYADVEDKQTKDWYKQRDERMKQIAKEAAAVERQKAEIEIKALRDAYGQIAAKDFLKDHPDVKKGSDDLKQIVQKAQAIGGNLEDAYKIVMYESNAQKAVEAATKKKTKQTQDKLAANVETKGVPPSLPPKDDKSFDEAFGDAWKELEAT